MLLALPTLVLKLAVGGAAWRCETLSAKMRIFRVPEFLATVPAVIGSRFTSCWAVE
jgi:hypothetical protein